MYHFPNIHKESAFAALIDFSNVLTPLQLISLKIKQSCNVLSHVAIK